MTLATLSIDCGDLPLGGGALALIRPALLRLEPGGVLTVRSRLANFEEELRDFCRLERHTLLPALADGHAIQRGPYGIPVETPLDPPERADPRSGFAPRGARLEPGGPDWPFSLNERVRVSPPETAQLYQQAVDAQWNAFQIPWNTIQPLPRALEEALGQVMTFLAENELSALYVPSRFLPRVHPAFVETAQFLATQLADEARHIEVFLRRARMRGVSSATTAHSLRALLDPEDFTEATFLLSVLGEGTFLDLLRFIEEHAPDEATRELTRRARLDEARHVRFGIIHVRHALEHDPQLYPRLEQLVRTRVTKIPAQTVPTPLADALTILAARGDDPPSVRRGHEMFRALLDEMQLQRKKRLMSAGLDDVQAETLSKLHTPNFM
jgi:hypothetical protein